MRELLSLRRDEAPIVGEVYKYKSGFVKCVADEGSGCEECFFDPEECPDLCNMGACAFPCHHFETVLESEAETVADVKIRHIEETGAVSPSPGERFISTVGLVECVKTLLPYPSGCVLCELTHRECKEVDCDHGCYYKRVKR